MAIYIDSKGHEVDTSTMAQNHLDHALAKAIREDNRPNIDALAEEILERKGNGVKFN